MNADLLAVAAKSLKLYLAVYKSEQGVIGAAADIVAGMDMCASLTNDDVAGKDSLSVRLLYAEALGLTVTAVLGRADTFLMCKKLQSDSKHFFYLRY